MDGKAYKYFYNISDDVIGLADEAEKTVKPVFDKTDSIKEYNQLKVISAMQSNKLSETHFTATTGYGYGDVGRETLENIYSKIFRTEASYVRHTISTGTQAIAAVLFGNLRPGDELLSVTGTPYDTLHNVIGINKCRGSLSEFNINYKQVDLLDSVEFDFDKIEKSVSNKTKMVFIQRSTGYGWRKALKLASIKEICMYIKQLKNDVIIFVDNCYGEFTQINEPTELGVDIIAGSLIKNPGGGIATSGGYITGKKIYVENSVNHLTAPGIGDKTGPSLGHNRLMMQGLFFAPHVVSESIKGAVFCSAIMERLGYETTPSPFEERNDIIQAIKFGSKDLLISFCKGIQSGSPVDAHVIPEPWDMPGYDNPIIMAAGGFVQGSSIELSADGPIKEPYIAYLQGGVVYECVKIGIMCALDKMIKECLISLN